MTSFHKAEQLLRDLGVVQPQEIDVDAIAFHLGAFVKRCPLDGCEALLIGGGDTAIVRVNSSSRAERQRFSVGHEIGHWTDDRGVAGYLCRKGDIQPHDSSGSGRESRANDFAANLLMPAFMMGPRLEGARIDFDLVESLRDEFDTSISAMAIRAVDLAASPALLIGLEKNGKLWFRRSRGTPAELWPVRELHYETKSFELLYKAAAHNRPVTATVEARRWLSKYPRSTTRIRENAWRLGDRVLTILTWQAGTQFT